jgi:hypothetical protein
MGKEAYSYKEQHIQAAIHGEADPGKNPLGVAFNALGYGIVAGGVGLAGVSMFGRGMPTRKAFGVAAGVGILGAIAGAILAPTYIDKSGNDSMGMAMEHTTGVVTSAYNTYADTGLGNSQEGMFNLALGVAAGVGSLSFLHLFVCLMLRRR